MFLLLFFLWVIFNGQLTLEIALFGIVIAGVMYAFVCRFMEYSIDRDIYIFRKAFKILRYILVLIREILKANTATIKIVLSVRKKPSPAIVTFTVNLKTDAGKALLANSITLTPGTITVALEGNRYVVHCLDKSMAEGIDSSVFVRLITDLESDYEDYQKKVQLKKERKAGKRA